MPDQSIESTFSGNDFMVYAAGPLLQGGDSQTRLKNLIVYHDENRTKIAEVRSTNPGSRNIVDHFALYGTGQEAIISFEVQSTYGFLPKVTTFVKDRIGNEVGTMVINSSATRYFMVEERKVLSSEAISRMNFRKGSRFKEGDNVVATIEMNKTGMAKFDGYKLSISGSCKRSYLIPLATQYMTTYAMISRIPMSQVQ